MTWATYVAEGQGAGKVGYEEGSGALPTISLTSGTAAQVDTANTRVLALNVTVASATTDTVKIELSPDDVTFSSLGTFKQGVAAGNALYSVIVPAGWWVKVTLAGTAAITSATYY